MTRELLIGAGARRTKLIRRPGDPDTWSQLTTLDISLRHAPDVPWDLNQLPLPFPDESFDEIHAYEVLEHVGRQGDAATFFAQFSEFWRLLVPGGLFCASVPRPGSAMVWADPSHSRVITPEQFIFLDQRQYEQIGRTAMTDFRDIYQADFDVDHLVEQGESLYFVLKAVKPARCIVSGPAV